MIQILFSDSLSTINYGASSDNYMELRISHVVPDSSTTAFKCEGLTSCPQALGSEQSVPTFKILIDALRSR